MKTISLGISTDLRLTPGIIYFFNDRFALNLSVNLSLNAYKSLRDSSGEEYVYTDYKLLDYTSVSTNLNLVFCYFIPSKEREISGF